MPADHDVFRSSPTVRQGSHPIAEGVLSAIGSTPAIHLKKISAGWRVNVFGKMEALNPGGSMKDRPALAIIQDGIKTGAIGPNTTIIESSSGNMGIGLAQVCRYLGLKFICVVDAKTCSVNMRLLRAYGAEVVVVREPDPVTHEFLPTRLKRVRQLLDEIHGSFWPNQYANQNNPAAHYQTTIQEIVRDLDGEFDYLFCPVSTCGTLRGCSDYLRKVGHWAKIVAVDALGSRIFTEKYSHKRLLPGLGAAVRPPLCNDAQVDEVVYVTDLDCVVGCRKLVQHEAILAGASSGGVISAIEKLSSRIPVGSICVGILPDRGERYLDQVYNDEWVKEHFGDISTLLENHAVAETAR